MALCPLDGTSALVLSNVDHVDLAVPDLAVALDLLAGLGLVEVRRSVRGSGSP